MVELSDFGDLSRAEREFADACQAGEPCILGDGFLPDEKNGERGIRGDLIRFFALGGGAETPVHDRGILLTGGLVTGRLDMSGSTKDVDIVLRNCAFQRRPELMGSHLRSLDLSGSRCPGLNAEGLVTEGALRLAEGFRANATVRLVRARVGSDLDCAGGSFDGGDGDALNADGIKIEGSLFLTSFTETREGDDANYRSMPFSCRGAARFISASIGDSVLILDAMFDAAGSKYALNLAHARIRRQLTMKRFFRFEGRLNLAGADVYSLNDDPSEETAPRALILNGFTYVHFSSKAPTDVALRLKWLARQSPSDYGQDFWAQPYGQLANVFREIGHEADARQILVTRDTLRGGVKVRLARQERRYLRLLSVWISERFMRHIFGYGFRPQRGLIAMALVIVLTAAFFHKTWNEGDMTPAAAPVLVSTDWKRFVEEHSGNPAAAWSEPGAPGQDYETFSSLAYAFDLFVPLIDLGQRGAWGPSTSRGPWGRVGWWLRWIVEIVGWVITAVAAAAVTGFVRRG